MPCSMERMRVALGRMGEEIGKGDDEAEALEKRIEELEDAAGQVNTVDSGMMAAGFDALCDSGGSGGDEGICSVVLVYHAMEQARRKR